MKEKKTTKGPGRVTQVGECLPSKYKAKNSIPNPKKPQRQPLQTNKQKFICSIFWGHLSEKAHSFFATKALIKVSKLIKQF
jgi:hypothetical protein